VTVRTRDDRRRNGLAGRAGSPREAAGCRQSLTPAVTLARTCRADDDREIRQAGSREYLTETQAFPAGLWFAVEQPTWASCSGVLPATFVARRT